MKIVDYDILTIRKIRNAIEIIYKEMQCKPIPDLGKKGNKIRYEAEKGCLQDIKTAFDILEDHIILNEKYFG